MSMAAAGYNGRYQERATPANRLELALAVAFVALAPVTYLSLDALYFTASDFFGVATLILMLVNRRVPLAFFGPATSLWLIAFLLFLGGLMLGSVVRGDPQAGLVVFLQYSYSLIIIPMVISARRLEETLLLMRVFVLSVAAIMLHGAFLVNFVSDPDPRLVSPSGRLRSLIGRENAAATMAAVAITFSVYLRMTGAIRVVHFLPSLAILVYGLLLTGSNTGFGVAVVGVGFVLLFMGQVRAILASLAVSGLAAFIILQFGETVLPEVFRERVFGALVSGDLYQAGTFEDRFELIREAIGVADTTIFLGLGADQFRVISVQNAPVHNAYLLILAEGGLISFLGLCGLFLAGAALGVGAITNPDSRARGALTLAIVVFFALLLNAFAHFYARFWHVPLALAMSLSLPRGVQSMYPYRLS